MSEDAQPSLFERLHAAFEQLHETDVEVRKHNRAIATQQERISNAQSVIAAERAAIRMRDNWLKKQAIKVLRKETGTHAIPGFRDDPEPPQAQQQAVQDKLSAVTEAAQDGLSA